jgi:hypothetical protein
MGLDKPLIPKPKPKKRQTVTKGSELKVAIIIFLSKTLILLPTPQRVSAKPSRSSKRRKTNHQIIDDELSSDKSDGESETDGLTKRVEKSTTYNPGAFLSDNEEEGPDESADIVMKENESADIVMKENSDKSSDGKDKNANQSGIQQTFVV